MHFVRARSEALRRRPAVPLDRFGEAPSNAFGAGASAGAGYDTRALSRPPPMYVDTVDEINRYVDAIEKKMSDLKKVHNDRLLLQFDNREGEKDREIDILTGFITQNFSLAGAKLKTILTKEKSNKLDPDSKIRKNIQRSLASKLQSLSQEFRTMQKTYLDQLKKFKGGGSFTSLIGETPKEETKEEDTGFTTSQLMDLMSAEELATERDQEIKKICESIEQLSVVFKELAALVIDQGTIIDRIDYNMEQAVERTTAGLSELKKAEEHQKSSRPLKCMVLLVVLIVVMVIILLVRKA